MYMRYKESNECDKSGRNKNSRPLHEHNVSLDLPPF